MGVAAAVAVAVVVANVVANGVSVDGDAGGIYTNARDVDAADDVAVAARDDVAVDPARTRCCMAVSICTRGRRCGCGWMRMPASLTSPRAMAMCLDDVDADVDVL